MSVITSNWGRVALNTPSHAAPTRPQADVRTLSTAASRSEDFVLGLDAASASSKAYNEQAFSFFLDVEHKRFSRSGRRFVLVLIDLSGSAKGALTPAIAKRLFAALSPCVRETDFMGWYRQDRVAGAVLTQLSEPPTSDVLDVLTARFRKAMRDSLPSDVDKCAHLRVCVLPSSNDQI